MSNNGKNTFYRTLRLDKEGWEALKFYSKVKEEIDKEKKDNKK